ncbi:hypothetical protein BC830DRAFT_1147699 [Chytriomyces sp. MP71]|nr:hypothetical protein BC830DRAFT_1147699 [Chytriomyces sp. MP71]
MVERTAALLLTTFLVCIETLFGGCFPSIAFRAALFAVAASLSQTVQKRCQHEQDQKQVEMDTREKKDRSLFGTKFVLNRTTRLGFLLLGSTPTIPSLPPHHLKHTRVFPLSPRGEHRSGPLCLHANRGYNYTSFRIRRPEKRDRKREQTLLMGS